MVLNVPWRVIAKIGRGFCRAIKKFPPLFLIVVAAGLGLGAFLTFFASNLSPISLFMMRLFGVACFLFYGTLLWLFISRQIAGTWNAACDYGYQVFADEPARKEDLRAVDEADQPPVQTGINVVRVWDLCGVGRSLLVLVDEQEVGRLRFGAQRKFALNPGFHEVRVQMDVCRSLPTQINLYQLSLIKLSCGMRFRFLFPLSLMGLVIWPDRFFFVEIVSNGRI
ncbi:MAG TPA: hypothetical protein VGM76_10930 [Lacipirellulaceae bacterium]|jgi:hypothetical protein